MKKLLILLLSSIPALAQHTVTASWPASPDALLNPTLSYNIYRTTGACPVPLVLTKIGSVAAGVLTFVDNTVTVGNTYCYAITSVLNGVEGVDSPTATAVILPAAPPKAPTLVVSP